MVKEQWKIIQHFTKGKKFNTLRWFKGLKRCAGLMV